MRLIQAEAKEAGSNGRVSGVICHVGDKDARVRLISHAKETYGGIDYLVSNAAVNPYAGETIKTPELAWDKIFDTNVKAGKIIECSKDYTMT